MSVIKRLLPIKSNFAITHAAATPNKRFRGTATAAVKIVRRIAASAAASSNDSKYAAMPLCNACAKTTTNGEKRNKPRNASAAVMSSRRTHADSPVAIALGPVYIAVVCGFLSHHVVAAAPPLQCIDD